VEDETVKAKYGVVVPIPVAPVELMTNLEVPLFLKSTKYPLLNEPVPLPISIPRPVPVKAEVS